MVYGFEPYEDTDEQGPVVVDLMQEMKFPTLKESCLDSIIDRCWKGCFHQLRTLLDEVESLYGEELSSGPTDISREKFDRCQQECQTLVENGLLN